MIWLAYYLESALLCLLAAELVRRRIGFRLPCFCLFVFAAALAQIVGAFLVPADYLRLEQLAMPLLAALQALASLEAFLLIVVSMVEFRAGGSVLFVVLASGWVAWEFWNAPFTGITPTQSLSAMERGVGIGLAGFLLATWLICGILGAERTPRRHAAYLALMSVGSAIGWRMLNGYVVMLAVILASIMWLRHVKEVPNWARRIAAPYNQAEHDERWREVYRLLDLK